MGIPKVTKEECTACEECVESCPTEAITMKDEIAVIDEAECSECGACIDACPAGAIKES